MPNWEDLSSFFPPFESSFWTPASQLSYPSGDWKAELEKSANKDTPSCKRTKTKDIFFSNSMRCAVTSNAYISRKISKKKRRKSKNGFKDKRREKERDNEGRLCLINVKLYTEGVTRPLRSVILPVQRWNNTKSKIKKIYKTFFICFNKLVRFRFHFSVHMNEIQPQN